MNKKQRNIVLTIIILFILVTIGLLYYISEKTMYNDEGTLGNTAGNLYNGGFFCEHDGRIYFSNANDDGALYSMDLDCNNVLKLSDDKAGYINVDDHYIYYARMNYSKVNSTPSIFTFYNTGVYRVDHDGTRAKLLYKDTSGLLSLYGNQIIYQHYNKKTGLQLYKVDIDGKNEEKLLDDPILPASYYQNKLYYASASNTHSIYSLVPESGLMDPVYDGNCYLPIANENGIYFIDLSNNYALCHINLDGSDKTTLVERFASSYNISPDGNTIFYQVDGGDNNRICKLDLTTMITETITDGNYKQIHVTTNYVFFRDFDETNSYAYELATGQLKTFHPPVIK